MMLANDLTVWKIPLPVVPIKRKDTDNTNNTFMIITIQTIIIINNSYSLCTSLWIASWVKNDNYFNKLRISLFLSIAVAHKIYGVAHTINSANYVYFKALERVVSLNHPECINIFTGTENEWVEFLNLHILKLRAVIMGCLEYTNIMKFMAYYVHVRKCLPDT